MDFPKGKETAGKGEVYVANLPLRALSHTAVINKPMGAHVDIMAPRVLVQAKCNSSFTQLVVGLVDEIKKSGIVEDVSKPAANNNIVISLQKEWGGESIPAAGMLGPFASLYEARKDLAASSTVTMLTRTKRNAWALKELPVATKDGNEQTPSTTGQDHLALRMKADDIPKGHVRFVLVLCGNAFALKVSKAARSARGTRPVLDSANYQTEGCVRLMTATGGTVSVCEDAFKMSTNCAMDDLKGVVKDMKALVPFVVDVLFHPTV